MKKETVLVIGSSGSVGSLVAKNLEAEGYVVRRTSSKGGDKNTAHINLATGEGVHNSFENVDKAFLLSPPGYADQYKILSPLIQEAKRRGLKKVVLMTALGANAVETAPFRRAEIELEKSGLNYNIIRPNWFMQNFSTMWAEGIRKEGKIALPAGTAKTSFIDVQDIAAVAAKLLSTSDFDNMDFDLTGIDAPTHAEVAQAIAEVTGKKVTYEDIKPETLENGFLAAGLPPDYVSFLIMIFGFLKEGYNAGITSSVKTLLGRNPHSFHEYVQDNKNAWL